MPAIELAAATLKEVVISGSRNEQATDELPMTTDVVNAKDIEEGQMRDIRDVGKDLPNVSVRRAPARFTAAGSAIGRDANAGFNIRGLEGNRVLMLVDGIRIPRSYAFGATSFGRDSLSIDLIKRIEIVKGASSVLYGSDGIAGLVNFITYEPSDFLQDGKSLGGKVGISYSGDDNNKSVVATLAGRASPVVDWQITAAGNRGNELANRGDNVALNADRTVPNPQRDNSQALLAKVVVRPSAAQKHSISFEHVDKKSDYELLTARAKRPFIGSAATIAGAVLQSNATNTLNRNRITLDSRYTLGWAAADSVQTLLSYQTAKSQSFVFEDRNTAPDRTRDTTYEERTLQAGLQADKTIRMSGQWLQKLTYGVDYTRANIINVVTGTVPPAGETFPTKRFPDTLETSSAAYVQNEIVAGQWSVTPGLRVDHFSIKPSPAGFAVPAVSLSGSAVLPKVGVLFSATDQWSLFGNYASGFRAPDAGQVNAFFENFAQFYKTIPNPNLKPETSKSIELGVRGKMDRLNVDVAVFHGDYADFIEDRRRVGGGTPATAANPTIFQSVNIDNVKISGFEVKGAMDWGRLGAGKLSTPFSYGVARGRVVNTGLPLDSIDPSKLSLGLRYETAAWALRLNAAYHAAKKFSDIGSQIVSTPPAPTQFQFATPASTTFDLAGQWRFSKATRVNASIVNLTNQKYWNWSDVRGVSATAVALDAYTQPGRKFNVSLVTEF